MKKSLIALAVLAASGAAMAQSSVTLFGIVDTAVGYVDNANAAGDSVYGLSTSGNATSRLGFRGVSICVLILSQSAQCCLERARRVAREKDQMT